VSTAFIIGCITQIASVSIICFAFSQILTGWIGHSAAHSRDKNLNKFGRIESSLVGGFSMQWWSLKHNMHHMFTNIMKFDEDIQHEYKVYFYPFLYLKWRFDSFVSAIKMQNYVFLTIS
jgi:fatty acid desaturase